MFGFKKSPAKIAKQSSVDPGFPETDTDPKMNPARRTTSDPVLLGTNAKPRTNKPSSRGATTPASYQNDFQDSGGLENQSVQELEKYAVYKAEETTNSVNICLKIAENIRGNASRTLDMLHQQGEQITRTHMAAVDIDKDLAKIIKVVFFCNGGREAFRQSWGYVLNAMEGNEEQGDQWPRFDSRFASSATSSKPASAEQREKLGLSAKKGGGSGAPTPSPGASSGIQQVEAEKAKQEDALSDLSNILGDLKGMAVDMGSKLDKQNKAIDHLSEDVDELNSRMKGSNQRALKLLG